MTPSRPPLGAFGVWIRSRDVDARFAQRVEELGYGALWIGNPRSDLAAIDGVLEATSNLTIGTAVVSIWNGTAGELADSFHRIESRYPDRFVLGVGAGHAEHSGDIAAQPFEALERYLEVLLATGVPAARIVLAALGPRVIRLSAERAGGVIPYLVPVAHTRQTRAAMGPRGLLISMQPVVLQSDPGTARAIARPAVQYPYLGLENYRRSFRRLGYTDDEMDTVADRLLDDVVVWGDDREIARRLQEQFDTGADHLALQLTVDDGDYLEECARMADILQLHPEGQEKKEGSWRRATR